MPKYRLLSLDELSNLEKEFIEYLVLNGITNDDWEQLKLNESEKTKEIIELFSDVVFEGIMRKAKYLVKIDKTSIYAFKCNESVIELATIETKSSELDFTTEKGQEQLRSNPPEDLKGFKASKSYENTRETELFKMIQNGCSITDNQWYDALVKVI